MCERGRELCAMYRKKVKKLSKLKNGASSRKNVLFVGIA